MARVVRCPQTLQVKATSIRRRGDLVKSDQGKVDTCSIPVSGFEPAGTDGPSIPDPVVHPRTFAALRTNPIAASWEMIGTRLDSLELDRRSGSFPLPLGGVEKQRLRLEERRLDLRGEKIGREEESMAVVEEARASMVMVLNNGVESFAQ